MSNFVLFFILPRSLSKSPVLEDVCIHGFLCNLSRSFVVNIPASEFLLLSTAQRTQQNIHGSVTGCGRQHPVTDPYTLRYRPGKVHVAYRLYIRICAALIHYKYGTDLLYGSVTDVLSYVLYTNCIESIHVCPEM